MRVTEELDAMRVMGIAHGYRLVMPRALALAIAAGQRGRPTALLGGMTPRLRWHHPVVLHQLAAWCGRRRQTCGWPHQVGRAYRLRWWPATSPAAANLTPKARLSTTASVVAVHHRGDSGGRNAR
jgi:hypothetical protein